MKLIIGDLWSEEIEGNLILVSGNAYLTHDFRLVMGRGAAKEAATRWRGLPYVLGERILKVRDDSDFRHPFYGVVWAAPGWHYRGGPPCDLGAFQVKYHWKEDADLNLIKRSTEKLAGIIPHAQWNRVAMNFPGIGNGRRRLEEVLPIIGELPDSVYVYMKRVKEVI